MQHSFKKQKITVKTAVAVAALVLLFPAFLFSGTGIETLQLLKIKPSARQIFMQEECKKY
ncbi:MAG: hypothetical protein NTX32_04740 [Candidatus Firestonebacteria bacterium]|nr:hypothetical protein [Candidatus Firestonebacteria bacterium]